MSPAAAVTGALWVKGTGCTWRVFVTFCLLSCTPIHFWKGVYSKNKKFILNKNKEFYSKQGPSLFRMETKAILWNCLPWSISYKEVHCIRLTMVWSDQNPVVQSILSLTSSLVVKMLTTLVSTISNSQVFLLKKNVSRFCKCKCYSHFFNKNIIVYAIFNDQSFNDTLTIYIVNFEQLGPGQYDMLFT